MGKLCPDGPVANYDWHWGFFNVKDRIVLDIGADWGSTADFFLDKGAKRIIAVEGSDISYQSLKQNSLIENRITPIKNFITADTVHEIENIIRSERPDCVKIDCEGAEAFIFRDIPEDILSIPAEYAIETHTAELTKMVKEVLTSLGYALLKEIVVHGQMSILHFCRGTM